MNFQATGLEILYVSHGRAALKHGLDNLVSGSRQAERNLDAH